MIHKIEEVRVYCGPAALIAVTGKRLPEVRAAVNLRRGCKPTQGIIGMTKSLLSGALTELGVEHDLVSIGPNPPTLANFVREADSDKVYIINITGHYVTYHNGTIIDNHYRFGTSIDECRWAKKRVVAYWVIK